MLRPKELSDLVIQKPEAVAPKQRKDVTKGVRVTKSLSSHRSQCLTYLDYTEQESHDNTFKQHNNRGRASYRFPEQRAFELSMVPTWQLVLVYL